MINIFHIKTKVALAGSMAISLVSAPVAFAHHSFAMFDNNKDLALDGVVREFQWTNPHSWIQLVVMENGQAVEYSIELSSPNTLIRHGWTRNSFKAGEHVTLTVHPLKDGGKGGVFVKAIKADGTVVGSAAPS